MVLFEPGACNTQENILQFVVKDYQLIVSIVTEQNVT